MTTKIKDVYALPEKEGDEKQVWFRIGVAFVNKDDSLTVLLDALPFSRRIQIRDRSDKNHACPVYFRTAALPADQEDSGLHEAVRPKAS